MNYPSDIEIIIDNPVLLEILQYYKDLGLCLTFKSGFGIGTYLDFEGNTIDYKEIQAETRTPAFYFRVGFEDDSHGIKPGFYDEDNNILDKVLEDVIIQALSHHIENDVTNYSYLQLVYDQSLYEHLLEELRRREDEINQAYAYVYWWNQQVLEYYGEIEEEYEYGLLIGERYSYKGSSEAQNYF